MVSLENEAAWMTGQARENPDLNPRIRETETPRRRAGDPERRLKISIPSTPSMAGDTAPDKERSLSLTVAAELGAVDGDWTELQDRAAVSPYQRFDLAEAWVRHAAGAADLEPRIGIVRDETDRVVMILPFGLVRQLGITAGVYLGGSHFNVNVPLADPELRLEASTAGRLLDAYCRATGADLLLLENQPDRWGGKPHPFLGLPGYAAPDDVRLTTIEGDYQAYLVKQMTRKMRSELRRKTVKFNDAGIAGATRAATPQDVEWYLAAFIEQKSKRLASQGLGDPFAEPGVKGFLREAALAGLSGAGGVELYALELNGQVLSVRAGVRHRGHLSFMVQSFDTEDPLAKYSPAEFLLHEMLAKAREQGLTSFDFGVGDGRFKQVWSNDVAQLFNIVHPVTKKGQLYAGLMRLKGAAIRSIKRNPRLFAAVQDARALSARLRGHA
jgi:CelD/BcsL family acetyltransferase involved in cellulose biosynthesis